MHALLPCRQPCCLAMQIGHADWWTISAYHNTALKDGFGHLSASLHMLVHTNMKMRQALLSVDVVVPHVKYFLGKPRL